MRKIIEFTGDGKSKDTAILFMDIASKTEHIKMQYRFMEERGIRPKNQTLVEVNGDKYLYDVHETPRGELWFKIPKNLPYEK